MKKSIVFSALLGLSFTISKAQIINTLAGNGLQGYSGDGNQAITAQLNYPADVVVDAANNVYIVQTPESVVRKVTPVGIISTFAGTGVSGFSGDGGNANAAQLNKPSGIGIDAAGNIYIADSQNQRIRKVTPAGIISTFAGTGTAGYNGNGIQATTARLNYPKDVAFDDTGNVYIADYTNNMIRKVNSSGIISTVAGNGGAYYGGDNIPATSSALNSPNYIAFDSFDNLYICDASNVRIRKVNTSGIITTFAGTGTGGFSGDGGQATSAQIFNSRGIAVDAFDNVYFSDSYNYRVRKVNTSGIITTIAGLSSAGYSGDGGPAALAHLSTPFGITFSANGTLYIADNTDFRVRYITFTTDVKESASPNIDCSIFPNPGNGIFSIDLSEDTQIIISNSLGQEIINKEFQKGRQNINIETEPKGVYFVRLMDQKNYTAKIIIQ